MIRKFTPEDIPNFPNVKILTYSKHKTPKDYLLIERTPFISAFVTINNTHGIFIEQYRPIIQKTTLEIPMGKTEKTDASPLHALFRELEEECNLFLNTDCPYILIKDQDQKTISLPLKIDSIHEETPNYLSPGFSTSLQYPFIISLSSSLFSAQYQAFSQENDLKVHFLELSEDLLNQLDGLSRFYLIQFLYLQSRNHQ